METHLNIIADVAGQFDALMKLIDKMPKGEEILLLGDIIDRGPKSKEIIQWAIDNNIKCLKGNHEDMFVDFLSPGPHEYHPNDFLNNGGNATLLSYVISEGSHSYKDLLLAVPKEHVAWLKSLPLSYETEDFVATHAPIWRGFDSISDAIEKSLMPEHFFRNVMWNRDLPRKREKFQIFGHNAYVWGLKKFDDWAICLDDSKEKKLTGMHWPSREIFQVPFAKKERVTELIHD